MNQYGKTAIKAVEICIGSDSVPNQAWDTAAQLIIKSESSRKKGCPRCTFLGLCEEGLVKGVPKGQYLSSNKENLNKQYAVKATDILSNEKRSSVSIDELWHKVVGTKKAHNSQMDIVIALFDAGMIE